MKNNNCVLEFVHQSPPNKSLRKTTIGCLKCTLISTQQSLRKTTIGCWNLCIDLHTTKVKEKQQLGAQIVQQSGAPIASISTQQSIRKQQLGA
jgi:hypothetical protein